MPVLALDFHGKMYEYAAEGYMQTLRPGIIFYMNMEVNHGEEKPNHCHQRQSLLGRKTDYLDCVYRHAGAAGDPGRLQVLFSFPSGLVRGTGTLYPVSYTHLLCSAVPPVSQLPYLNGANRSPKETFL